MTLIVIQNIKTTKKSINTKTKRFQYDLEQKSEISEFLILPYGQDRKLGNVGNFYFFFKFIFYFYFISLLLQILTVVVTQDI